MDSYFLIDKESKLVINCIVWDGETYLDQTLIDNYIFIKNDETLNKGFPISIGDTYDETHTCFIPPKPEKYPSWVFNYDKLIWEPPVPKPNEPYLNYFWDENSLSWQLNSTKINSNISNQTPDQVLQKVISSLGIST